MDQDVIHWMQGQHVQNFGDFLSQYFMQRLFYPQPVEGEHVRLIGSCIDDMFVPTPAPGSAAPVPRQVFWGCGMRRPDGLSADRAALVEILAVRGPLSRSALRLGTAVPIGDPALLLPALHKPPVSSGGATVLVPHFHERRSDAELLALTGCTAVLRPNLANDLSAVGEFIDQLTRADFVLSGALHGALTAAAYGRKFAFWEHDAIDLPFKWQDAADMLGIPCAFQPNAAQGRAHYDDRIAPALRIPVLWPLLVAAPLPIRPDAFVSVLELDLRRHGPAAFDIAISARAAQRLQARLQDISAEAMQARSLRGEVAAGRASEAALRDRISALAATEQHLAAESAARAAQAEQLLVALGQAQHEHAAAREQAEQRAKALRAAERATKEEAERLLEDSQALSDALEQERRRRDGPHAKPRPGAPRLTAQPQPPWTDDAELARLAAREAWLAAEEARLHEAVRDRDIALAAAQAELQRQQAHHDAVLASRSWRLTAPIRGMDARLPWLRPQLRRALRLLWLSLRLQLRSHLAARRRLRREVAAIAASPLFDAAFYLTQHPDMAGSPMSAAQHYVLLGDRAGLAPNQLFDPAWYRRTYLDGTAADRAATTTERAATTTDRAATTTLFDYLTHGADAGHDPHPLFDAAWYAAQQPQAGSGADLLLHYLTTGVAQDAAPNRLFHVSGYRSEYPDMQRSGLDPVQHYLRHGAARGYDPHPLFDGAWYAARHAAVRASGMNPLAYYLRVGAAAGHQCSPLMRRIEGLREDQALALPRHAEPEASIVIPAYGHFYDTVRCLYAIMAHAGDAVGFETILIDDHPDNPTGPLLADVPGLQIIRNETNLGFLRSCNRAAASTRGWHIIFLNNDTVVGRDWLAPLLRPVRTDKRVGMVGCKLLNADGSLQEAGGILFDDGWGLSFGGGDDPDRSEYNYRREVDVVVGAAFLVRRELFEALGGFDDRYAPAFYEEFDLAFQIRRAGFSVIYQPHSAVTHLGSSSYGAEIRDRQSLGNHAVFCLKWEDALATQPAREADTFLTRQRPGAVGTILMIDDKVPEPDRHAGALTIFQYINLLQRLGFRLVFAPADGLARQPYTARLQDMGIEVLTAPTRLAGWLRENGRHLAAVWTARPDITAPLLDLLRQTTTARILYYPHDLHYLREMRRYLLAGDRWALGESQRLKRLELQIFRAVDCVMTPSPDEAAVIRKRVPDANVHVIPPYLYPTGAALGLDAAAFDARTEILFVGGFKHPPNTDAALWLVQDIMPLVWQAAPAARLTIVGDEPGEAVRAQASDRVAITGYVPDLQPYFARARLSVAPLRYGAGVKGKIVGSLQAGIPVVTTAVGNEGIALVDGTEVLLGETPATLAAAILRLLADPAECAALSHHGAAVIEQRFSERRARAIMSDILGLHRCLVCGHVRLDVYNHADDRERHWSERFACDQCFALNRTAALADVLRTVTGRPETGDLAAALPFLMDLRIHEFSVVGPIVDILRASNLFTCSEYLDGVPPGTFTADDLMCQDLQALTFRDDEFDLLISQDVFEHVPDADLGLREVFRVLKPGGRHIFTVPFNPNREHTLVRAELTDSGTIRHLLRPDYHGDPLRDGGSLAFRDFGRDLLTRLASIGFEVKLHEFRHSDAPGGYVAVFETAKPSTAT